jgi:Protein of unknown function (DUF3489)
MTKEAILAVLEQREGTTITTIMAATGWQEHSERGSFFRGAQEARLDSRVLLSPVPVLGQKSRMSPFSRCCCFI